MTAAVSSVSRLFLVLGFPVVIVFSMLATLVRTPVVSVPVVLVTAFYNYEHITAWIAALL